MNAEASVVSQNWGKLLSGIPIQCRYGVVHIELTDSQADLYDFANERLMQSMRESLVAAIRRAATLPQFLYLTFGNKFFMTMNEQKQRSFFHSIFNLPGHGTNFIAVGGATDNSMESPAITISTSALLETLPQLCTSVEKLVIGNFALTGQSDVQAMSNIILAKRATLKFLGLESIKCPVDDCMKQDSDEPNGFFDPLLHATSGLDNFILSAKPRSVHSTLVSPMAVRALFVEGKKMETLILSGLGLTDSHVLAIVDGLSTPGTHLNYLNLCSNPGITAQGYDALFNLINRANVIGFYKIYGEWHGFSVDDKAWEGKLNLVSEMNSEYGRLEYLMNGSFASGERRWQWLERVVYLPSENEDEDSEMLVFDEEVLDKQIDNAKRVDFIWYILRENPEMMLT